MLALRSSINTNVMAPEDVVKHLGLLQVRNEPGKKKVFNYSRHLHDHYCSFALKRRLCDNNIIILINAEKTLPMPPPQPSRSSWFFVWRSNRAKSYGSRRVRFICSDFRNFFWGFLSNDRWGNVSTHKHSASSFQYLVLWNEVAPPQ